MLKINCKGPINKNSNGSDHRNQVFGSKLIIYLEINTKMILHN